MARDILLVELHKPTGGLGGGDFSLPYDPLTHLYPLLPFLKVMLQLLGNKTGTGWSCFTLVGLGPVINAIFIRGFIHDVKYAQVMSMLFLD